MALRITPGEHTNSGKSRLLVVLVLAAVLLPSLGWVGSAWVGYRTLVDDAARDAGRSVDVLYQHAVRVFETQELVADMVDRAVQGMSLEQIQSSRPLHEFLKQLDSRYPPIGPVWIFGPQGEQGASSRFFPVPPVRIDDRDYYKALQAEDTTYVTEAYPGKLVKSEAFNLARRMSPRGDLHGIILVSAFVDYHRDFMAQVMSSQPGAVGGLVREDGALLARWPALGRQFKYPPGSGIMKALATNAQRGVFHARAAADGVERVYAFRRLDRFPVFVLAGVSLETFRQAWSRRVAAEGVIAALTAALLLALSVIVWGRVNRGEEARQTADARFRAAQEAAMDGFVILEPIRDAAGTVQDFRFVYANPVTLRNACATAEDLATRTLCDLFPASRGPGGILEHHAGVADSGEPTQFDLFYTDPHITGWFRNRVVKLGDYIAATFSDITEEVKAREAAEAASRAKSDFFASASHDLRQPLQALRLFIEVLSHERGNPRVERAVAGAAQALQSAEALLHSLLDVARIEAGVVRLAPQPVALEPMFRQLASEFAPQAERKGLSFTVSPPRCRVFSDPDALLRIVRNLATNAVRYTVAGGVLLGCRRRGGMAVIEVWDTGPGIPADRIDQIWQEFVQLDNPARDRNEGLGLGLAIVRKLAHSLGHRLEVASRPGKGTVFRVTVPLAGEPVDAVRQPDWVEA